MSETEINRRSVWMEGTSVYVVQQNLLPFQYKVLECETYWDTCMAITDHKVQGTGSIAIASGYAMVQAFLASATREKSVLIREARHDIEDTGPASAGIAYVVDRVYRAGLTDPDKAVEEIQKLADELAACSESIGIQGQKLLKNNNNILIHGHAGWLSFMHTGTALAPVYKALEKNKKIFVYVDESRPLGQGGHLTAWELNRENVPHVIIPDNAAATLMSRGLVHAVIVSADRISLQGDVVGKIGTLGRAVLAFEFGIPFYVAAPRIAFDADFKPGKTMKFEEHPQEEVLFQTGTDMNGNMVKIQVCAPGSKALNPAFDVTPSRYVTGFMTDRGIIPAGKEAITEYLESVS